MFTIHQLLIFAARAGNLDLMRERIAAGADVSYFDAHHGSALLAAVVAHQLSAVQFLITKGVDINMADARGQGALEYSLRHGNDNITAALLEAGARLKPHALPHFKKSLSEYLRRSRVPHEVSPRT